MIPTLEAIARAREARAAQDKARLNLLLDNASDEQLAATDRKLVEKWRVVKDRYGVQLKDYENYPVQHPNQSDESYNLAVIIFCTPIVRQLFEDGVIV